MKTVFIRTPMYERHLGWWKAEMLLQKVYDAAQEAGLTDIQLTLNRADRKATLLREGKPILVLRGAQKGWLLDYDPNDGKPGANWIQDEVKKDFKVKPMPVFKNNIYENFTTASGGTRRRHPRRRRLTARNSR